MDPHDPTTNLVLTELRRLGDTVEKLRDDVSGKHTTLEERVRQIELENATLKERVNTAAEERKAEKWKAMIGSVLSSSAVGGGIVAAQYLVK